MNQKSKINTLYLLICDIKLEFLNVPTMRNIWRITEKYYEGYGLPVLPGKG